MNTYKIHCYQINRSVCWTTWYSVFFKDQKIWSESVLLAFFLKHFEKLGVNVTPETICMEDECGLKKHTECSNLNLQSLLFGMLLNQRMTSSVFFHWLKFSSLNNFLFIFSKTILLIFPILFLDWFINKSNCKFIQLDIKKFYHSIKEKRWAMQLSSQKITFQYRKMIFKLGNTVGNLYCFTKMKHGRRKTLMPHLLLRWRALMVRDCANLFEFI